MRKFWKLEVIKVNYYIKTIKKYLKLLKNIILYYIEKDVQRRCVIQN